MIAALVWLKLDLNILFYMVSSHMSTISIFACIVQTHSVQLMMFFLFSVGL